MSLIKTFPEIDYFFRSNKFSEDELNIFLKQIEKNYSSKELRKAALNLINLELAKFQIVKDQVVLEPLKRPGKRVQPKIVPKPDDLQELKQLTVQMIADKLRWRVERVQTFLLQNGLTKAAEEILNPIEFNYVKEMFISRLKALQRIDKKNEMEMRGRVKNKKTEKSLDPGDNVYFRISQIGLGKVIYIRKK